MNRHLVRLGLTAAGVAAGAVVSGIQRKKQARREEEEEETQRREEEARLREEKREAELHEMRSALNRLQAEKNRSHEEIPVEAFETVIKCPACGAPAGGLRCDYCGTDLRSAKLRAYQNRQEMNRQRQPQGQGEEVKKGPDPPAAPIEERPLPVWRYWRIIAIVLIIWTMGVWDVAEETRNNVFYLEVALFVFGWYMFSRRPRKEAEQRLMKMGAIRLPDDAYPYEDKNYKAVAAAFRAAGFTRVRTVNLRDLNMLTSLIRDEKIESVQINGEKVKNGNGLYMPDASIVITYHGEK